MQGAFAAKEYRNLFAQCGYSQEDIDRKVVELVKAQHAKARQILEQNRAKLDELAKFLYEKETISGEEFMQILTAGGDKQ